MKQLQRAKDSCHIIVDLTRVPVIKKPAPNHIACLPFQRESGSLVLSQAHIFPFTESVKKKKIVQGTFYENPECNQLSQQLNQSQQ